MAELRMYSMAVCLHSTPRLQADHFLNCWHLNYQKIMLHYCPLTCDSHAWADQLHRHQWNGADSWGSRTQSNIYYTDYVFSECKFEIWMKTSSGFDREALLWIQIWEFESYYPTAPSFILYLCLLCRNWKQQWHWISTDMPDDKLWCWVTGPYSFLNIL